MADTHIAGPESLETSGNGGFAMPGMANPPLAARGSGQALSQVQPQRERASDPAWKDYQTVFTNAKAGMEGVDKARVQQIVWEMSKDSAHFKNEQRKQASVQERIERMKSQAAAITPAELAAAGRLLDARIASCEARRDLTRTWLHVDMDCFYAAVHEREQPELKRLQVAVGGMGMICTANYVARRFDVRSAMPAFIGKRLCPKLVFIKPDFAKYTAAAEVVRGALRQVVTAGQASKRVKAEESLSFLQTELKLAKKRQQLAKKGEQLAKKGEQLAKKDLQVLAAKKDLEVLAAKKDQELANKAAEVAILKAEMQKLAFQNHKHMVELLAYKKLLTTRGLIEFVEAECMPKAYKGLQRADKWRTYFKKHENLAQCAAHHGFSNPAAEIVTIFRDLSDDIHNLNATRFMTRFKTELLRFGPPLSLRQAELLVCIAKHLGFRSEAHGVLEKTVSP